MQRGRRFVLLFHAAVAASPILVAATLYAIVLLALDPALRTPADATLLLGYLIVFHAALLTPFVALAWLLTWLVRPPPAHPTGVVPLFTCSLALCGAALLGLNLVLRFPLSYALYRLQRLRALGYVN